MTLWPIWPPCEDCGGWDCVGEWFVLIFGIVVPLIAVVGLIYSMLTR